MGVFNNSEKTPVISVIGGVALFALPIEFVVWLIKLIARKKHKSTLKTLGITALIFLVCIVLTPQANSTITIGTIETSSNKSSEITPREYMDQCTMVTYQDIARNPQQYKNKDVCFYGEVMQVQENGSQITLLVNMTLADYGIWSDTVWVEYSRDENDYRVLEKDIVNVYGVSKGIKTYMAVLGNSKSVPYIKAKIVELSAFEVPENNL